MQGRFNDFRIATARTWFCLAAGMALVWPFQALAQSLPRAGASSSFSVVVTVRPEFHVIAARPVGGGHEYRVWTNMKSVRLKGEIYRFDKVGEAVILVPGELMDLAPDANNTPIAESTLSPQWRQTANSFAQPVN